MHSIKHNPHPDREHSLVFQGTPRDLAELVWGGGTPDDDYTVIYGGLYVKDASADAKHDGHPAFRFDLADGLDKRPVGRLVLLDTEISPSEWEVCYADEETALENLAIFTARATRPKVSSVTVDMVSGPEADPDETCARLAAEYGVSLTVVNPSGPGGGWPEVCISGFTDRVETILRKAWEMDTEEVNSFLDK